MNMKLKSQNTLFSSFTAIKHLKLKCNALVTCSTRIDFVEAFVFIPFFLTWLLILNDHSKLSSNTDDYLKFPAEKKEKLVFWILFQILVMFIIVRK